MPFQLLAYILVLVSFAGFAYYALIAPKEEQRQHMTQLFSTLFVGGLLLLLAPGGEAVGFEAIGSALPSL